MVANNRWLAATVMTLLITGAFGWDDAAAASSGIWIDPARLASLPTSGAAWSALTNRASQTCSRPDLSNQDDSANVCVLAKALVFARTGNLTHRLRVVDAIWAIVNAGTYDGRALALGRELGAYVIAADLIDLKTYDPQLDRTFRSVIAGLLTTPTTGGPATLIECHERRPNNWGTHCGGSRAAVAAYLGDTAQLGRIAAVFKGWLGDRSSYAGFVYGDLAWQCDPNEPVGINPLGCKRNGHSIDGVLPDDQRRGGGFTWPPPQENYVYEALQGALLQAMILERAGYDPFTWENRALARAFAWLQTQANYPSAGDDTWQPHVVNHFYAWAGVHLPAPLPSSPGKNLGWTDWTHAGAAPGAVLSVSSSSLAFSAIAGSATPAGQTVTVSNAGSGAMSWSASSSDGRFTVTPSSGSAPGSFQVRPTTTSLAAGSYAATVTVSAGSAVGSPATIAVAYTITGSDAGGSPPPSGGGVMSLGPVADAFVRGGTSASMNFGGASTLIVKDGGSSQSEYDRRSLLRFDLGSAGVARATLHVYVYRLANGTPARICAFAVASDTWTESKVTWNNQPSRGSKLSCRDVTQIGWQSLDVSAFVAQEAAGDRRASFMLADDIETNRMVEMTSREGNASTRPTLVIQ